MVERESSQASPGFVQQSMNSNEAMKSSIQPAIDQCIIADATNVQEEAESLCNTILNVGFNQIANTLYLPTSERDNFFSVTDLNIMNQRYVDMAFSNGSERWEIIPEQFSSTHDQYLELGSPVSLWGCPMDLETLKMDDVFQVDKADLVQSPTLAELNANDESLFDSFDSFDLSLPSESKTLMNAKSPKPQNRNLSSQLILSDLQHNQSVFKTSMNNQSQVKILTSDVLSNKLTDFEVKNNNVQNKTDDLDTLKIKLEPSPSDTKLQTVPNVSLDLIAKQLKSPLPAAKKPVQSIESQHLDVSKNDCKEENQPLNESLCLPILANDDAYDSDEEDSDMEYLYSSDAESLDEHMKTVPVSSSTTNNVLLEKKKSRYFWQYNIQAKGPKGPKVKLSGNSNSPHKFPNVGDPVFSATCQIEGVKHAGKARRGDGNDLTPNPQKLYNIGVELQKLNSVIDDLIPVNELPFNARSKSRKEKNKLASRACRLKKKAQHEANKLKLFGLQQEQKYLLSSICQAKKILRQKLDGDTQPNGQFLLEKLEFLTSKKAFTRVAGHSADFVNHVLEKVATGDSSGGVTIVQAHEN